MEDTIEIKPDGKKPSLLSIIVLVLVGLVSVGLIGIGGVAWFIVSEMERVHGGRGTGSSGFFLGITVAGTVLLVSIILKACRIGRR